MLFRSKILDDACRRQQAPRHQPGENQRLKIGTGSIKRGRETGAASPDDDNIFHRPRKVGLCGEVGKRDVGQTNCPSPLLVAPDQGAEAEAAESAWPLFIQRLILQKESPKKIAPQALTPRV